jgi:hypothetical protein
LFLTLHKETIKNEFLWSALLKFQNDPFFENYHLVGGTALSLLIGHRVSDDIDLFTKDELQTDIILRFAGNIQKNVEVLNDGGSVFQLYFPHKELKVDFVQYSYDLLDPLIKTDEGLHIIGKNDISVMKMAAVGQRGHEAKDFVDLFFLLKEIPIEKIIDNFKIKYETDNPIHYIRSMAFFDDVSSASWKSISMVSEPLAVDVVKNSLIKNVRDYENRILGKDSQKLSQQRSFRR